MKSRLKQFIEDHYLFTADDKLLVAVSGGVDSIVLCHLLHLNGYTFSIAHCNFQLRGKESEGDELFVNTLAKDLGVACHTKRFDTEAYVFEKKVSTQMAARELRYQWFQKIRQKFDYQYIVTAHHASDNIETVLYNFAKSTGLRGVTGMKPKNDMIVRPFLWAKKEEIVAFAQVENLAFREDSSNDSDKYARNYIRHRIVPSLQHINPSFETTAIQNIKRLAETQELLDFFVAQVKQEITQTVNNQVFIHKEKLKKYPSVSTLLFELVKDFGFNTSQVMQILKEKSNGTGALFYSQTHKLLIDRDDYIIAPQILQQQTFFTIEKDCTYLDANNMSLIFEYSDTFPLFFSKKQNLAFLDAQKLQYPLVLRKWQEGDRFQPFGMAGKSQLLSDFFRLKKLSQFEKEAIWILETAQKEICWVIGFRIDERFKMTQEAKSCLTIQLCFKE